MKEHIDSSDEEPEYEILDTNLVTRILLSQRGVNVTDFKIGISLLLRYLADRFFKQSLVHDRYKQMKKHLSPTEENKNIFNEAVNHLSKHDDLDHNVKYFNSVFNPYDKTITTNRKKEVLLNFNKSKKSFKFLDVPLPSLSSGDKLDAGDFLALSQVISRHSKNLLKYFKILEVESHSIGYNYLFTKALVSTFSNTVTFSTKNLRFCRIC